MDKIDLDSPGKIQGLHHIESFQEIKNLFHGNPIVLFQGTNNLRDITIAKFIIKELAFKLRDCYFIIVGQVCNALKAEKKSSNIILTGPVDRYARTVLISISDIVMSLSHCKSDQLDIIMTPMALRIYRNLEEAVKQHQRGRVE